MNFKDRIRANRIKKEAAGLSGFVSLWDTTLTSSGSSTSTQVKLPLVSDGVYNFNVDWGDGSNTDITAWNVGNTHTYSSSGEYTITITGEINGWQANNTGDKLKIQEISSFGTLNIKHSKAFKGCNNLVITATDELQVVGLTDATDMFGSCFSLTSIPLFDTSSIQNFTAFCYACSSLTSIPLFDTSSATAFSKMFMSCSSLTTIPLLNSSSVTLMNEMFRLCSSLTSVPLLDMSLVTSGYNMFINVTLSTASYSAFLENLDTLTLQSGVPFHGGSSKYNTDGQTARTNIISNHSWTFTDGGLE